MISIIICSRDEASLSKVSSNVALTIGVPYEIVAIDNSQGQYGICAAYNKGAGLAKFAILCFMHEDISFETNGWGNSVVRHLSEPSIGLIGVAGGDTKSLVPSSWPSSIFESEINIIQYSKSGNILQKREISTTGYPDDGSTAKPVAALDGVWLCTRKNVFKKYKFDEQTLPHFHGYDIDYCLQVQQDYKIYAINDIRIHHYSEGSFNRQWIEAAISVSEKWKTTLPLTVRSLTREELVRQHWTSMNVFLSKLRELNYSPLFKMRMLIRYSRNDYFHFRHFLHSFRKLIFQIV